MSTRKCSTFAVSSVRCRRARPPHVGKRSDSQTEPCQERICGWSRMSLARPGCPRRPTPRRKPECQTGQGVCFALDGFDAVVLCAGDKKERHACSAPTGILRSVGVRSTFHSSISFLLLSCVHPSVSFLLSLIGLTSFLDGPSPPPSTSVSFLL